MLRIRTSDEVAADEMWRRGAVAITAGGEWFDVGFASDSDERAAAAAIDGRYPYEVLEPDDAWADAWRSHASAVVVGPLTVRPAWVEGPDAISIEPGRAFGIGAHPTTRLALEALVAEVARGDRVLDVGTGTGVLAIAAAALGATSVAAIDVDPHAVEIAAANVAANGWAEVVDASNAALESLDGTFDVVVANLGGLLTPLALCADLTARATRTVIVSGLLDPEVGGPVLDPLEEALGERGFATSARWSAAGWTACAFSRRGTRASRGRGSPARSG